MEDFAKSCKECGELFFTRKSKQVFCLPKCSYKYYNKKKKRTPFAQWTREKKDRYNQRRKEQVRDDLRELFAFLGNQCARCGFDDTRALQLDHVNGGGVKELRATGNKKYYYRKALRELKSGNKKYQILCANCNWIKRFEDPKHPRRLI